MKDFYFILGNGFTIDFLTTLEKKEEDIDVVNLFSHGDRVPYPKDQEPGFLSNKRCPNLWALGARPHMDKDAAMALIEDIITCANMANSAKERQLSSTYVQAYQELSAYLKYLFVYYNKKISDEEIQNKLTNWGWLQLLKKLNDSTKCNSITIVTLNYDIWLERILINHNINFEIGGLPNGVYNPEETTKIKIIKPHGSISFSFGSTIEASQYKVTSTTRELVNGKLHDYKVNYENLENIYMFNAIIPPAGDSQRLANSDWSGELRTLAVEKAKTLNYSAELFLSGISYWHVDRAELDEILTRVDERVNVKLINPRPSNTLSAVLTSLFSNHVIYKSSNILGDLNYE
ncbi:hypothetical protein ACIQZM_13745 [Peribacillus sp. NPDC097206]|uniref:hypothetical protein n=1 Tax=Peribacillus sp. NPDC097206 TaxID=3364398 RepID=UPI0038184201